MDNVLIKTAATHETRNEPQVCRSPVLGGSCVPSTSTNLACRLVQIALVLYLMPAFLILLLVGAVGVLVVGTVRLFTRLLVACDGRRENVARDGRKTWWGEGDVVNCNRRLDKME